MHTNHQKQFTSKKNKLLVMPLLAIAAAQWVQAANYVTEAFTGTSAPGWTFVNGQGDGPSLTAPTVDPDGDGWLRLTKDATNQSSFVYYNDAIPTVGGLVFTFDLVIWGSRNANSLADGVTLAIFDAAVTPGAGAYGGSLGYAQRSGIPGLAGGIVGFGFDVFGNFSNPTEGRLGGTGQIRNSVAIRGSMGADRNSGYEYITGTGSLGTFSTPGTTDRSKATVHTIRISIPTDQRISVEWREEGKEMWEMLINQYQCNLECPENIKFGFTGGTGASYANQEIRNLSVTAIPEPGALGMALGAGLALLVIRRRHIPAPSQFHPIVERRDNAVS